MKLDIFVLLVHCVVSITERYMCYMDTNNYNFKVKKMMKSCTFFKRNDYFRKNHIKYETSIDVLNGVYNNSTIATECGNNTSNGCKISNR